jgi:tyrosyl-DNA phosphodiesterase 2
MQAIIAKAIQDTAVLRKTSVAWEADKPHAQDYYAFDSTTSAWVPKPFTSTGNGRQHTQEITNLALYTWNVDFMLPFAQARMEPALAHLHSLTRVLPSTTAPVIFLQECTPEDLVTISNTAWIRERYHLLDINPTNWATTHYGTTTLVDARLPIASAFRVHYAKTRMDRDALCVDVVLGGGGKTVRLCNTHLESLALDPPFRPSQVQVVARYMHEAHLHAALAAGDFNAIQPFDRTLHSDNGLRDAYLELGGQEDSEEGFTWGQQAATQLREQFGCSRMDKVYFCGGVRPLRFERFGADVLAEGQEEREQIVRLGFEKPWVTDHLGVVAEVQVTSSEGAPAGQL